MDSAPIMNKGGSKKTLFTCFKPAEGIDDSFKPVKRRKRNATPDPVLAYLSAADEDGIVFSAAAENGEEECRSRRRKKRKNTWQNLRTAMIKTPLMRKILNRWRTKKEPSWRSIEASGGKRKPTRVTNSNASSTTIDHGSSSIFTSPSLMSSTSSSSHTNHVFGSSSHETNSPQSNGTGGGVSMKNSGDQDRKKRNRGSKQTALCILLIISLLVLILWGKFLAIVCTLIWFYLVPLSRRSPCNEKVSCGES